MEGKPAGEDLAGSRAEYVYRRLKEGISQRRFEPGQPLREAEIAEWLSVSRTPVRDAFRLLESDGLLVSGQRRGLTIRQLDHQDVSEIYGLLEILEGFAARLAAQHGTPAEIEALSGLVGRQDDVEGNASQLAGLNRRFHQLIYRAARNRYLNGVLESLDSFLGLLPGTTYSTPERPRSAVAEHKAVAKAIAARDPDKAEAAMRAHTRANERSRLMMLSDLPG